jgi:hypothetical protein
MQVAHDKTQWRAELTAWSWVLLRKPPVAQLLKNFPTFYIHKSSPVVSILNQMNPVHTTPSYSGVLKFNKVCNFLANSVPISFSRRILRQYISSYGRKEGARDGVVGWDTMLQAGSSRFQFPMRSLHFSIDLIIPAALWPWGRLRL